MAPDSDRESSNDGRSGNSPSSYCRRGNERQHVKAASQSHGNKRAFSMMSCRLCLAPHSFDSFIDISPMARNAAHGRI